MTRRRRRIAAGIAGALVLAGIAGAAWGIGHLRGGSAETTVVLREGRSMFDYARELQAAGVTDADAFLAACRDPAILREHGIAAADAEGFLFPDKYRFRPRTPAERVVRKLLANFRRRVDPAIAERRAAFDEIGRTLGVDPSLAVVTLASIVEAETAAPDERAVIASVAWNRLTALDPEVTKLQMDPTVSYGCVRVPLLAACAGWNGGEPTRAMLEDPLNRYNTYQVDGLPPGPIGNPGLASIRAVLERRETQFLFYVARGDGTHEFTRTFDEHRRAVRKYRGR